MSVLSSCFSFSSHPLSIEVSTSKRGRGLASSTYFPLSFFGRFAFIRFPFALHTVSLSRSLVTTDRVSEVILVEFVGPTNVGNAFDTIPSKAFDFCGVRNRMVTAFAQPDRRHERSPGDGALCRSGHVFKRSGRRAGGGNKNKGHTHTQNVFAVIVQ